MASPSITGTFRDQRVASESLEVLALGTEAFVESIEPLEVHWTRDPDSEDGPGPDPDPDRDREERVRLRTTPSLSAAESIDGVDCLVCQYPLASAEPTAVLERARRLGTLPVLFVTTEPGRSPELRDVASEYRWAAVVVAADPSRLRDRLSHRLPRLVERRRLSALSHRSVSGLELAGDAIAIVAPDGTIEFANRAFTVQLGADRDALVGRPWQDLFAPTAVDRLEETAIPTVEDGWRWSGTATGRRPDGADFEATVRIDGLEDGTLVFAVDALEQGETKE
ncbi:PAS sensor protein [Halobiforma lacisalsi AJ5]|uniref:PAS sensor protein n=1 Tax=Natronobacterium lacisalsi AJ5 TaxID=358396 RepID=M0LKA2_NATLA|nr:PAS domain-containing protein [Halobiforma lacisalsi]APW97198.1 PAS sensor protein [Halobiforma lacisalsi AJ5]EMA34032.1 PAS sensor protein [Halobiforma lacisalsi AJ5]